MAIETDEPDATCGLVVTILKELMKKQGMTLEEAMTRMIEGVHVSPGAVNEAMIITTAADILRKQLEAEVASPIKDSGRG